jgi:hypothetical protein
MSDLPPSVRDILSRINREGSSGGVGVLDEDVPGAMQEGDGV